MTSAKGTHRLFLTAVLCAPSSRRFAGVVERRWGVQRTAKAAVADEARTDLLNIAAAGVGSTSVKDLWVADSNK